MLLFSNLPLFIGLILEIYLFPIAKYDAVLLIAFAILLSGCLFPIVLGTLWDSHPQLQARFGKLVIGGITFILLSILPSYFLIRSHVEFGSYAVAQEVPPAKPSSGPRPPLFLLLSDTHITDREETVEGFRGTIEKLGRTLSRAASIHPAFLIITGDLTDRGHAAEWRILDAALAQAGPADGPRNTKLVIVPGNHDLQEPLSVNTPIQAMGGVSDSHKSMIAFLDRAKSFHERAVPRMAGFRSLGGGELRDSEFPARWSRMLKDAARAKIVSVARPMTGSRLMRESEPITYVSYPGGFPEELHAAEESFDRMFPLVSEDPARGVAWVILNSSARLSPDAAMGLGDLGDGQIARLRDYLRDWRSPKSRLLLVLLHHPPVRRSSDVWRWGQLLRRHGTESAAFAHSFLPLDCAETRRLVDALDAFRRAHKDVEVAVAFGHRHGRTLGRTEGGVWMIEAPSVANGEHPGFWSGDIADGRLKVSWIPLSK